jgi:hypothetical protein
MNEIDSDQTPVLALPSRPEGRLTLWQFLRVVRDNTLATYPPEAFEEDIITRRLLWRRRFIINEPNAIRHVLLDNAANYTKSELSRRLLEPALGRGLLTSEGETWRRHRRIMAPAFDHRSILGCAPIVTKVTADLLERWAVLPDLAEIDVAAAMMHTALHIISRAMFSSDSDDIVDVVERGVGQYQATTRPVSSICYAFRRGSRSCFRSDSPLEPSTSSTSHTLSKSVFIRIMPPRSSNIGLSYETLQLPQSSTTNVHGAMLLVGKRMTDALSIGGQAANPGKIPYPAQNRRNRSGSAPRIGASCPRTIHRVAARPSVRDRVDAGRAATLHGADHKRRSRRRDRVRRMHSRSPWCSEKGEA